MVPSTCTLLNNGRAYVTAVGSTVSSALNCVKREGPHMAISVGSENDDFSLLRKSPNKHFMQTHAPPHRTMLRTRAAQPFLPIPRKTLRPVQQMKMAVYRRAFSWRQKNAKRHQFSTPFKFPPVQKKSIYKVKKCMHIDSCGIFLIRQTQQGLRKTAPRAHAGSDRSRASALWAIDGGVATNSSRKKRYTTFSLLCATPRFCAFFAGLE
jgi:hypothetical protein